MKTILTLRKEGDLKIVEISFEMPSLSITNYSVNKAREIIGIIMKEWDKFEKE